ncbi:MULTISPECIES: methylisocitrate lyase [Oceanimonas]|uniref:2-methylisocitrate lyase n=1 Tax=Oceanimonas doudoroffii TaxID=84158 RepID=A0A233RG00_9GAMM|nr:MULTISPECIES: methylisocitrate lyase [Oceanimonas]NHI01846.1 2-methylisocitrate lyase [Oceanimonas sp. MB9]OXY82312.1 methylisocitrate lyase [Oceanimonas doudoroffii]
MRPNLFDAIAAGGPLALVGAVNAYSAMQAEQVGHRALYLSGAGVANASFGLPDLGITTLNDVLEDARRITAVSRLPLLVDVDTGFGGAFGIARTVKEMERAGVAAIHIEDQVVQKRCGHRPNKAIVSQEEMVDRIRAAVDARGDPRFAIMARTDALAVEGMSSAIERAQACVEAGADMIFPEAMETLAQYRAFCEAVGVPVLANITEFGKTPLFSQAELAGAGVAMVLYPLSAFRAMSRAAESVYRHILADGHQRNLIHTMQTREQLYQTLGYHHYEQTLDSLFSKGEDA